MPETCARLAMTRVPDNNVAQPAIQPIHGPMLRVTQAKVVPQSASTRLSRSNATAMHSIGRNAISSTAGTAVLAGPSSFDTKPSVAARLYAGAVEAMPIASAAAKPMAPRRKPWSAEDDRSLTGGSYFRSDVLAPGAAPEGNEDSRTDSQTVMRYSLKYRSRPAACACRCSG